MRAALNPFNPGSGLRPPALVGRDSELTVIPDIVERTRHGLPARGVILSGLRGVGKTVLLNRMRDQAEQAGWLTVSLEAQPDTHDKAVSKQTLARELTIQVRHLNPKARVSERVKKALGAVSSFNAKMGVTGIDLGVAMTRGRADSGNLEIDLPELAADLSAALLEQGKALGIFIDELQDLDPDLLRALLIMQHQAGQKGWPIYLFGAGLPHLPGVLADTRSYAERLFDYRTISSLTPVMTGQALTEPVALFGVTFNPKALEILTDAAGGYPYFIQELGRAVWETSEGPEVGAVDAHDAVTLALARLDQGFFRSRWERATLAERRMLIAMSDDAGAPTLTSAVAERMGVKQSSLGPYRARLIHKGLVYAPEHRFVAFTVPGMAEYIRRHQDD